MFCILYRFQVLEGMEAPFIEHWESVTLSLREAGSLGSCLHHEAGTSYVAYARWPSREMWQQERTMDDYFLKERAAMAACCASIETLAELAPVSDLLELQS